MTTLIRLVVFDGVQHTTRALVKKDCQQITMMKECSQRVKCHLKETKNPWFLKYTIHVNATGSLCWRDIKKETINSEVTRMGKINMQR